MKALPWDIVSTAGVDSSFWLITVSPPFSILCSAQKSHGASQPRNNNRFIKKKIKNKPHLLAYCQFFSMFQSSLWGFHYFKRTSKPSVVTWASVHARTRFIKFLMIFLSQEDSSDGFSRSDDSSSFLKSTGWIANSEQRQTSHRHYQKHPGVTCFCVCYVAYFVHEF